MFQLRYFSFVLIVILLNNHCFAKDYGTFGNVYEIQEQDILEYIHQKLNIMEKNGEIVKFQEDMKQKTFERVKRPKLVKNLEYAMENKKYYFDPSITLQKNYFNDKGKIFAIAGTKINPLDKVSLRNNLIFIDGDSKEQVKWAFQEYKKYNGFVKIILVNGAVIDLMNKFKIRLYFDQNGALVKKFNMKKIPVLIKQENKQLLIEEVTLKYEN